jgi:hypothetical protein
MNQHSAFAVRAEIDTPISVRENLHLDGLLLEGFRRFHGEPIEIADLPLAFRDGVPMASGALFETVSGGAFRKSMQRVRSNIAMRADAEQFHATPDMPREFLVVDSMSPYRPMLTAYELDVGVRAVWWTAFGDRVRVAQALGEITGLGAMAGTGYGRVVGWSFHDVAEPSPVVGWMDAKGLPIRAVPVEAWKNAGGKDGCGTGMARAAPPYWTDGAVDCVLPRRFDRFGSMSWVSENLGVLEDF